jgi:glyoxylase I family protein
MIKIKRVNHITIICKNYQLSRKFYLEFPGFDLDSQEYREARQLFKAELSLNGTYIIKLYSFPETPPRLSKPEAAGLRHISFEVGDIESVVNTLLEKTIFVEPVRIDEFTGKKFIFIAAPDGLPIEFYES